MHKTKNYPNGFTLTEFLVAIAIIGVLAAAVTVSIPGSCGTITSGSGKVGITSVTPGAVIKDFSVLVRGFVNVPAGTEVGVTVNGRVALVNEGQFGIAVPVDKTVTSLNLVAKDAKGSVLGNLTVPVTVAPPFDVPALAFEPSPSLGPAPLKVSFKMRCLTPTSQIELDVDGNGKVDFQGPSLEGQQFSYGGPGLYFPSVKVTDKAGNTYTKKTPLLVVSRNRLEALLQSKWTALKNALRANNIPAALDYIAISKRATYGTVFGSLKVPLAQIDKVLTNIRYIEMTGATVEYEMLRTSSKYGKKIAYLVRFSLDEDGIWRISSF